AERVRFGDRFQGLDHVVDGFADGEGSAALQVLSKVDPAQVLHDHKGGAGLEGSYVDDAGDVRALDLDSGARLSLEAPHGFSVLQRFGQKELDGDSLVESEVSGLNDNAHPAATEDAVDPIFPREDLSGCDLGAAQGSHSSKTTVEFSLGALE